MSRFRTVFFVVAASASTAALAQQGGKPGGVWNCQSALGPAVLDFRDGATLTYGGQPMAYRIASGAIQVVQDGMLVSYPYQLQGSRLDITTPEGDAIRCVRPGDPAPGQQAGQPQGGGTATGGLNHLLQGQLCAWSGSSSGGSSYSTTRKVFFDGRGQFGTGSESSFNVISRDGGGNEIGSANGYGAGPGEGGTYEVTAARVGAPIRVKWNTGEDDVAYVHFVSGGRITEVKYGKLLFGAGLCE